MPNSATPFLHTKIQVLGCGGHARSVADILLCLRPDIQIQFYDLAPRLGETLFGFPVSPMPTVIEGACIAAIGDSESREKQMEAFPNANWISVIAADAHIGKNARIGAGTFIASGAHIGPQVTLGIGCIVNTHAIIEHDCQLGAYCHVAPNATVCGGCEISDHVFLGAGATVIENLHITSKIKVGASATVIVNLEEAGKYVGSPARKIK